MMKIVLNCFYSFRTENPLKKDYDYCYVEMPDKDNKILKYNSGEKHIKVSVIMYVGLECFLENISTCHENPNKSSTIKINKHTPSGYSLFTYYSFDNTKNKLSHYRGENCIKILCKDPEEHAKRVIYCRKKEMMSLTDEENKFYVNQKFCYICKKRFTKDNKKVRDHCHFKGKYRGAAHNKSNMNYKISRHIPVAFHNGSIYDYHFIIKELTTEFEGEFECLGENTEKYITFSVQINKEIRKTDKDGNDKTVNIPYKFKFIDSFRFMSTSLSSLVDNLSDGLHSNKCTDCDSNLINN